MCKFRLENRLEWDREWREDWFFESGSIWKIKQNDEGEKREEG
jgi:hypothetical protein